MTLLFPLGLEPVSEVLNVTRGCTFRCKIRLYADKAQTEALNIEGCTAELTIDGWLVLTIGDGLTVTADEGEIVAELTAVQTKQAPSNRLRWNLIIENGTERVCPVEGTMEVQ